MNNRELAAFILLGLGLLLTLLFKSTRTIWPSIAKQLFASVITLFLAVFVLCQLGAIWLADRLSLWSPHLVGASVLWFLLVGFAWFINLGNAGKDSDFFKKRFVETLGITAVVEFFVNAQVMPLPLELVGQTLLLFVIMLNVVARGDPKLKSAATLTSGLLIVATLSLLLYSAVHLVHNWASLNKPDLVDEFILPIWLTAAAVPVLYAFAFYMGYQQLFRRLSVSNDFHQPTMRARWGVMLELRGKLVDVDQFRGGAARDAAQAGTVREAREAVRRFRAERAAEANARATARQLLIDRAGQQGLDDEGLVLDRREFATTKSALRWLATCQMGWYRNQDRPDEYRPDLLDILTDSKQLQLESDEPIHMKVRKDRQAWYAYRRTPSGHVFGIGARGAPPSQWFYDADVPPSGYPSNSATGWTGYLAPERPEWRDEPAT